MPRGILKANLPSKVCVVCVRPFTWRKKWEKCWDEVSTCSKACNAQRRAAQQQQQRQQQQPQELLEVSESSAVAQRVASLRVTDKEPEVEESDDDETCHASDPEPSPGVTNSSSEGEGCMGSHGGGQARAGKTAEAKAEKKALKAKRREKREGGSGQAAGKECDLCSKSVTMLVRCQVDESRAWRMVCGRCWKGVSGGVTDGDAEHPHYRYGGIWKQRL